MTSTAGAFFLRFAPAAEAGFLLPFRGERGTDPRAILDSSVGLEPFLLRLRVDGGDVSALVGVIRIGRVLARNSRSTVRL
eukprot:scaffold111_cov252-Pinguiococcus_pyrenoidosus.AAC.20